MHAIVEIGGKQYKVAVGDQIVVDRLEGEVGKSLTFDRVLLAFDATKIQVGEPVVAGKSVKAKIIEQGQGEKIHVGRYKSKVRYRKHIGFRAQLTTLEITAIG